MPNPYYGIPGNVVYPGAVNIASSTNASPISVTTSSPHGLQTGDVADIQGHAVNTKANGVRTVTRTGASTFTINGSTGNGVGAATGTVQPINYGAGYNIVSDGTDPRNAASVNVPFQALGDRSLADLVALSAQYKLAGAASTIVTGQPFNTAWMSLTGPVSVLTPMTSAGLGIPTTLSVSGAIANDIAEVSLDTSLLMNAAGAGSIHCMVSLGLGWQAYGGGSPLVTVFPQKVFSGTGGSTNNFAPLSLRTWTIAPSSLSDGSVGFQLFIAFYANTDSITETVSFTGDALLTAKLWRATGAPF